MSVSPAQPRVLVIDDNAAIHEDFRKILGAQTAAGTRLGNAEKLLFGSGKTQIERTVFRIDSAYQGQDGLKLVEQAMRENDPYAVAFVDIRMPPGWDGITTLSHLWECAPDLQAVICTAYSDYSWDDMLRRFGKRDNLLILKKPFETVEVLQVAHALANKWELTGQARLRMEDLDRMVRERTAELQAEIEVRARVQAELRISEERFSKAFLASPMPMAIRQAQGGRFLDANPSFTALTGYNDDQLTQRADDELGLWPEDTRRKLNAVCAGQRLRNHTCTINCYNGVTRETVIWAEPISLGSGPCALLIVEDVTVQLKLEAQLRQAQKMEAVGRLGAGVAHEFNNILTVIQGHADLLCDRPQDAGHVADCGQRISRASKRAAALTRQLLAFSRKQTLQLKPLDLSAVVRATQKMLGQLLSERYQCELHCIDKLPSVLADEGGIEQILVNLSLNARDAMPQGGIIRIETSAQVLNATSAKSPDARPGSFICLTVSDNGCGMNEQTLNRIFDPFYTTKEVGKGTGLGLSTILGIVRQHQGWIEVDSQPGNGSTFKIFFPAVSAAASAPAELNSDSVPRYGSGESILLVEDEPAVRDLARAALERGGYLVFEAPDGREALQVWKRCPARISLLVTDMVMPNDPSGGKLAQILRATDPSLPVIYITGYGSEFVREELPDTLKPGVNFLSKPFDPHALLKAVKRSLAGANHSESDPSLVLA